MNGLTRRQVTGFVIDGAISRDLDDAIYLRKEENGYTVVVSISDVSHAVLLGSDIDLRARQLAFTRYFAQGNNPMLPHRLSEDLLSLLPRRDRDVIVYEIRLNDDFEITGVKIELGRFKAFRRFTHKEVDDILEHKGHTHHSQWMAYYKFAENLLNRRRTAGAMVIYDLSRGLYTNEEGQVVKKTSGLYFRPYIIVQEFMILANRAVTEYLSQEGVPLLYRNHALLVSDANEKEIIRSLYGAAGEGLTPNVLAELNNRIRAMVGRAQYEAVCKGHFGLNLKAYAQWTSPIRRFADLVNHRQLRAWLIRSPYPYTADEIAAIGDHINKVESDTKDHVADSYKAEAIGTIRRADEAQLLMLEAGHFSLFIRLLVRGEVVLTEMRVGVIERKLQENALSLVDKVHILFSEVPDQILWRQTQKNVLQAMVVNPVNVQAVLEQARSTIGWESSIGYTQVREGVFTAAITVTLDQRSYVSERCEGHGKVEAETNAFFDLLQKMTSIRVDIPEGKKMPIESGNHKGRLLEVCQQKRWPLPTFEHSQMGTPNQPLFICVIALQRPNEERLTTEPCTGLTKKSAERMASEAMLVLLGVKSQVSTAGDKSIVGAAQTDWRSNPISALQEYCQGRGYDLPMYSEQRFGRDHAPSFTVTCMVSIEGTKQSFEGKGPNKKKAKQDAAMNACKGVFVQAT